MGHKKSFRSFTKKFYNLNCFLSTMALLSIFLLSVSGIVYAQYQYKTKQSYSTGGEAYIKVTSPAENEVWEKGKRYTIKWESKGILGNVKIVLASESAKPIEVSRSTVNSGSFNYVVPRTLGDGTYRVQVTKIDGSVKGESAAITIKGQTFSIAKAPQTGQPSSGVSQYGTQTGTAPTGATVGEKTSRVATTPPVTTAPSAGVTPSAATTPTAGTSASPGATASTSSTSPKAGTSSVTPSVGISGRTPATAAKVVKLQFAAVKVSEAEQKNLPLQKSTASSSNLKIGGKSTSGGKIEVYSPSDGDIWEVDKEYGIRWQSTGITGDVKIVLESTLSVGGKRYSLPITERTPDTGSHRFRVPQNWGQQRLTSVRIRVSTLDGTVSGTSPGTIKVCTQHNIDLECKVMDMRVYWKRETFIEYPVSLEFNVWMRNKGTHSPVNIQNVLVKLIKQPDGVVVYQEDWAFSGIYGHDWYKLPESRKIDIEHLSLGKWSRLEVELDPQNSLHEDELFRHDNKTVEMIKLY